MAITLIELIDFLDIAKEKLREFSAKADFKKIEKELMIRFDVKKLIDLPKEVITAYNDYKQVFLRLSAMVKEMEFHLRTYDGILNQNDVEVSFDAAEIIKIYEMVDRCYVDFQFTCSMQEAKQKFPGKLFFETRNASCSALTPTDFSVEFMDEVNRPLINFLSFMSGRFDAEAMKKMENQFSSLNLNSIEGDFLNSQFGKDTASIYFDNQAVIIQDRPNNQDPRVKKKIEDFTNEFLTKTGFPVAIKPKLKLMLTTLGNQGLIMGIPSLVFAPHFSINKFGYMLGLKGVKIHFRFNSKHQLAISFSLNVNRLQDDLGNTVENMALMLKINFVIDIAVQNDKILFQLQDSQFSCYMSLPKGIPPVIRKSALKCPQKIPANNLWIASLLMDYLSRYLGYRSLKEFYAAQPKAFSDYSQIMLFSFIDVASQQTTLGTQLSLEDREFLNYLVQNNISHPEKFAREICAFVPARLNSNEIDFTTKARYLAWLEMAQEIGGIECLKDNKMDVTSLYKLFSDQRELLMAMAENSAKFYQEMVFPNGLFVRAFKFTHHEQAKLLAKHAILFEGDKGADFVKKLTNFTPEVKLLFSVEFVRHGGDVQGLTLLCKEFFNKQFITEITRLANQGAISVLKQLQSLIVSAPIDSLVFLRSTLPEAFVHCDKWIKNQSLENTLIFLNSFSDLKICKRVGANLIKGLLEELKKRFAASEQEYWTVFAIVRRFQELLNSDADFLLYDEDVPIIMTHVNDLFCLTYKKFENAQVPEKKAEDYSSSADDEMMDLLADKEDKGKREQIESQVELSVQKLNQVKDSIVVLLPEKPLVLEKSSPLAGKQETKVQEIIEEKSIDKRTIDIAKLNS